MASSEAVQTVLRGHLLLAVCAALYLAWWIVFFRPGATVSGLPYLLGSAALVGAAIAGIAGAIMVGSALPAMGERVPLSAFAVGAVVVYLVLAYATRVLFSRPVTTELLLIVAWCTLEFACVAALGACGAVSAAARIAFIVFIAVLGAGSLVAYVLYYNLGPLASFIDGAVPLAAVGLEALVVAALLR